MTLVSHIPPLDPRGRQCANNVSVLAPLQATSRDDQPLILCPQHLTTDINTAGTISEKIHHNFPLFTNPPHRHRDGPSGYAHRETLSEKRKHHIEPPTHTRSTPNQPAHFHVPTSDTTNEHVFSIKLSERQLLCVITGVCPYTRGGEHGENTHKRREMS